MNFRCFALSTALLTATLSSLTFSEIEILDADGNLIRLDKPAERIISLAPSLTEILFAIDAGKRIVGVIEYSDFPLEAKKLPVIGRFDLLNVEKIVELEPDLIVAWKSGNPERSIEQLKTLGLTVFLSELTDLPSISEQMKNISKLTGTEREASSAITNFNQTYQSLVAEYSGRKLVKTFYQVWDTPIITAGGKDFINDIIKLCSGENVFKDINQIAPKVGLEAVIFADPEVIIGSGSDQTRPDWLDNWKRWPKIKAVSKQNLFSVNPDLIQRQTPRILIGAKQMCEHINKARIK